VAMEVPEAPECPGKLYPRLGIRLPAVLRTRVVSGMVAVWID
jgi:hypothetical protein